MSPLARNLAKYGEYHRDRRNVITHLVGIPLIVLAVMTLLARPIFTLPLLGIAATPALIAAIAAIIWYAWLDVPFGLTMAVLFAGLLNIAGMLAKLATPLWLGIGIGLFVVGWALQFLGHHYEGRKPAFLDDLRGLLVGPLFVVAEVAVMLGLRKDLRGIMAGEAR